MQIYLNGEPRTVDGALNIAALLADLGLGDKRVAVEVNREIVPRSRHGVHALRDQDRVEVVNAIGGG